MLLTPPQSNTENFMHNWHADLIKKTLEETHHERAALSARIKEKWELIELLTLALPYVEEGEEFNHPSKRNLSKRIRAIVTK